jgi:hypothetical protein
VLSLACVTTAALWGEEVKVSGMSEQNNRPSDQESPAPGVAGGGVSRRALIRAGMAAVPVVAAMKTEMVLATTTNTTVRPSSFASFQANNCSVSPGRKTTGNYLPLADCSARCYNKTSNKSGTRYFHSPYSTSCGYKYYWDRKAIVPQGLELTTWFNANLTPTAVAAMSQQKRLALYCAAAYLATKSYPSDSFLTSTQLKAIWDGYGQWSPMAGVTWTLTQTLAYFDRVYGVGANKFDACLTSGSGGTTSGGC